MSPQPQKTTSTFEIEFQVLIQHPDGNKEVKNINKNYDKNLWDASVEFLHLEMLQKFKKNICLISMQDILEGKAKSEEHIILQGLGTKWIKLPPGFVNDEINNGMCGAEDVFLNTGLMGALRPFYLTKKKSIDFKDKSGRKVEFRNDPQHGFEIHIEGFEETILQKNHGSGNISFRLPIKQPDPLNVSRAIHKIAYLALCVHLPKLVFQISFDGVRQLIEQGTPETYRPHNEEFIPGACPGFHVRFLMVCIALDDENLAVMNIFARLRLHHILYSLSLLGHQDSLLQTFSNAQYYPLPEVDTKIRYYDLSLRFDKCKLKS